jgi:hypothetical protein
VELRKLIVEEYLKHVIALPLIDSTPVYSFLRSNIIDTGAKKETVRALEHKLFISL